MTLVGSATQVVRDDSYRKKRNGPEPRSTRPFSALQAAPWERASAAPVSGQVGGQVVMVIPQRAAGVEENVLLLEYQRVLAAVRRARPGRS